MLLRIAGYATAPILAAAVAGVSLLDPARTQAWLAEASYFLLLALVVAAAGLHLRRAQRIGWERLRARLRAERVALGLCLLVTLVAVVAVKAELRLLSDEANLVSVSWNLGLERTALNVVEGRWLFDDSYWALQSTAPRRPLLFPFLAGLLHGLGGFSLTNVFALNALVLFALLFTLYRLGRSLDGETSGWLAILLAGAQPVVLLAARSAGFDLLAALLLAAVLSGTLGFLRRPSGEALALLWVHLLLLAHARYESFLYLLLVPAALVALRAVHREHLRGHAILWSLSPALLLPRFWQAALTTTHYEAPPGVPPFALGHAIRHGTELVRSLFEPSFTLPYAAPVLLFGVAALVSLAVEAARSRRRPRIEPATGRFLLVAALVVGANVGIFLCFHRGSFTHPLSARFFVVLVCALSLAAAIGLRRLLAERRWLAIAIAFGTLACYVPVASEGRFAKAMVLTRETNRVLDVLERIDRRRILVVSDRPVHFAALRYGSYSYPRARGDWARLLAEHRGGGIEELVFVQEVETATGRPLPRYRLPEELPLETLALFQNTHQTAIRVARVRRGDERG